MTKPTTKITPLDPSFHGESNYEVGLEDLLVEKRNLVAKTEAEQATKETITVYKRRTPSYRRTMGKLSYWNECFP